MTKFQSAKTKVDQVEWRLDLGQELSEEEDLLDAFSSLEKFRVREVINIAPFELDAHDYWVGVCKGRV